MEGNNNSRWHFKGGNGIDKHERCLLFQGRKEASKDRCKAPKKTNVFLSVLDLLSSYEDAVSGRVRSRLTPMEKKNSFE